MNDKQKNIIFIIFAIALFVILSKFMKGASDTLHKFNIGESDEAKNLKTNDAFSPIFYKQFKNAHLFNYATSKKLADEFFNARTLKVYVDDSAVIATVKKFKNKSQLSFVSEIFTALHGEDLITYLDYLTSDAKETIYSIIKKLPNK